MLTNFDLKTKTIFQRLEEDSEICEKAKEMLHSCAEALLHKGSVYLDDWAAEFAESPPMNCQILDEWDGEDPEGGLASYESIWHAMGARVFECNFEKLTTDAVQSYWSELETSIREHKDLAL